MTLKIIKAKKLKAGDGIGVFAPSMPAHLFFLEKYNYGIHNLKKIGFNVIESTLIQSKKSQSYRSASAKERAAEFMELIENPKVNALMAAMGGSNSSSLIPYLDYKKIRESQKVICGYSDVTSLHLAILKYAGLSTFYGPAVMSSFGEYPDVPKETKESFLAAVTQVKQELRLILPPLFWSHHFRDARTDEWKTEPRQWNKNKGWRVLEEGQVTGDLMVFNLSTLLSNAGTPHFPDFDDKILLIETASGDMASEERQLRHLDLLGVFDKIKGLIVGKPESFNTLGAPFFHDDLIQEIVGERSYPIMTEFDCSHTVPMLTLAQLSRVSLFAQAPNRVDLTVLEPMVEE